MSETSLSSSELSSLVLWALLSVCMFPVPLDSFPLAGFSFRPGVLGFSSFLGGSASSGCVLGPAVGLSRPCVCGGRCGCPAVFCLGAAEGQVCSSWGALAEVSFGVPAAATGNGTVLELLLLVFWSCSAQFTPGTGGLHSLPTYMLAEVPAAASLSSGDKTTLGLATEFSMKP